MTKSAYKARAEKLANQYWVARKVEYDPESTPFMIEQAKSQQRALWKAMDNIAADPLPQWVKPELVALADHLAMKERTVREDLAGSPIVCRGCWPFDDSGYGLLKRQWSAGWDEIEGLDTHNLLMAHDHLHAIITYCEGDLTLDIFETEDAYRSYFGYIHRFYKEHA